MALPVPSLVIDGAAPGYAQHLTTDVNDALNRLAVEASDALVELEASIAPLEDVTTDRLLGRDTAGSGDVEEIAVTNGLEFTGSQQIGVANDGITNARLANMAASTFKMRVTGSTGDPEDGTAAQANSTLGGSKACFSAHKNGTDQAGIASATDTVLTFGTEVYDQGAYYDAGSSLWTPPSGPIHIDAHVYVSAGLTAATFLRVIIYKNGAAFKHAGNVAGATTEMCGISIDDVANGTDFYQVYVNLTSGGTGTVSGSALHTYFMGHQI